MSEESIIGIASVIVSIGMCTILAVFAWMFYQITRMYKNWSDIEESYTQTEVVAIENIAKKLGINVEEYLTKKQAKKGKSFRRELEEKAIEEYFKEKNKEEGQ